MQQVLRMKVLIAILAALALIGVVLTHQLRVSQQAADATTKLSTERERAAQIDRDDQAAIKRIRERNAQQSAKSPKP